MSAHTFAVRATEWRRDADKLRAVRTAVFIDEQAIPEELEWDCADHNAMHVLAEDAQRQPIGCARLLADGHIGRVAVLSTWRRHGVGDALMARALELAASAGMRRVALHSQAHACGFYARHGFAEVGDVFDEAGIPHQTMARDL